MAVQMPPMPSMPGLPDQAGPPPGANPALPPPVPEIRLARKSKSVKRVPKGRHKVRKGGKRRGRKG